MRKRFLDKRIPTLLGLILVIFGIGLTSYLVSKGAIFISKAGPSQVPQNVKITNISDASFTVTYATEDNVFGSVNYGATSSLGQTALDDRDSLSKAIVPHTVHSINVNNLNPSTTYYFSITSAENKYDNNKTPFTITTAPQIEIPPSDQKPASGKILMSNGNPPNEALIYLFTDNSQLISTLVKNDGSYLLPLNSIRSKDLSTYLILSPTNKLKINATGKGEVSNATTNTDQINPVPTITLSNNYDFTNSQTPIASESAKTASSSGFPTFDENSSDFSPAIISPSKDQGFSDSQPTFKGTATPNETVTITIHSDSAITTNITADSKGNWQYRPTVQLSAGDHSVTIQTKDNNGILKTITQSFTIYASGNQLPNATLSITPTPIPSPTPNITPSPTPVITPTPIVTPIPTILVPTPTPIALTSTPLPTKTLPPTGNPGVFALGIFGIGITIIGALILISTRGGIPL